MTRRAALLALVAVCVALALTPARAEQGAPAQTFRVYLPLVAQPPGPPATVRFGSGLAGGALSGVGASFPAGLRTLYYEVAAPAGGGLPFRLQWSVGGVRRPELDRAGFLPTDGAPLTGGIARSTGEPLPPGEYAVRVFVGGPLVGEGQARIE